MDLIIIGLFWLGLAVITGVAASGRGRDGFGWFVFALFIPLLPILLVLALQPLTGQKAFRGTAERNVADESPIALRGTGKFEQKVVECFWYQEKLEQLKSRSPERLYAILKRDPNRQGDPNAVAVGIDNLLVGYLPEADAVEYCQDAPHLGIGSAGAKVAARYVQVGKAYTPQIGVELDLEWPLARR